MTAAIENTQFAGIAGKSALVSGGASGIGQACARLLSSAGACVSILDIDAKRGNEVASSIDQEGGQALFIECDVSKDQDCQSSIKTTFDEFGSVDILVTAAGITTRANVIETSEDDWDQTLAVNLKSVYLLSKYAIPLMAQAGGGSIINISSGWGLVGGKEAAAYCASKGGVVLLTKAMALDHGQDMIRVNCVCPGDTDTPMFRSEAAELGIAYESFIKDSAVSRPLGRIGQPEDIARAVLFLTSTASSYMTGSVLVVDGGGLAGTT